MFIVIYRWELQPTKVIQFEQGWSEIIRRNIEQFGALGSRLHHGKDNLWVSYSQWPSREYWQAAHRYDDSNQDARQLMVDAMIRQYDPIELTPVIDHLLATDVNNSSMMSVG